MGEKNEKMTTLSVKPIPTRNWKNKNIDLVIERDKDRKNSQESVDKRIYYLWFNYLKLCLNLEDIKHTIEKKGRGGTILSKTRVKVSKTIYKKWDLQDLSNMNFKKWYKDPKHQKLFTEGGFNYSRGSQYHSLVKRYNVFIEYYNKMNSGYEDEDGLISSGRRTRKRQLCEDIVMKFQKERYEQIERTKDEKMNYQTMVLNDINLCEKTILSVCQGEFPKSKSV